MSMLRINERTKQSLRILAEARGESMARVVEDLVDAARSEQFFAAADAAYRRLREDPGAWGAEADERAAWDATLDDGLEDA